MIHDNLAAALKMQRYILLGAMAEAGQLDNVRAAADEIKAVVNKCDKEAEGLGQAALLIAFYEVITKLET